jgi:hypothetical protein
MESNKPSNHPDDWERKVFQSSHVHSGQYSQSRRMLILNYGAKQHSYKYHAPPALWEELKKAQSPGRVVRSIIHPNFIGVKVDKNNADV